MSGRTGILLGRVAGAVGALAAAAALVRLLAHQLAPPESTGWLVVSVAAAFGIAAWVYLDWEWIARLSGQRASQRQAASWVAVGMAAVIVGLVNYISARHFATRDLTEGQIHSLSPQTVEVLSKLGEDVLVTGFYREAGEMGTEAVSKQKFEDLAERYRAVSPRVKVEVVDPDAAPWIAQKKGVLQNGTVYVASGTREEKVVEPKESDLTNALIKATRKGRRTVYFTAGHGEKGIDEDEVQGVRAAAEALRRQGFEVKALDLVQEGKVPADADVVVVAGPRKPFQPQEIALLEGQLARKRGLILLLDPAAEHGLGEFTRRLGVDVRSDLVIDPNGGRVGGDFTSVVGADYATQEISEPLAGIATLFGVASSLERAEPAPPGVEWVDLVKSTEGTWGKTDLDSEDPNYVEGKDRPGPLVMAMLAHVDPEKAGLREPAPAAAPAPVGPRTSPPAPEGTGLAGGEEEAPAAPPAVPSADTAPPAAPPLDVGALPTVQGDPGTSDPADLGLPGGPEAAGPDATEPTPPAARAGLVVVGDSDFASNALWRFGANPDLFQNAVSYLAREGDLLAIRAREDAGQPLEMTIVQLRLLQLLAIFVLPALAGLGVVGAWMWRRAR